MWKLSNTDDRTWEVGRGKHRRRNDCEPKILSLVIDENKREREIGKYITQSYKSN